MEPGRTTNLRLSSKSLAPRDISETLGKLPPQSIPEEEVVLGAVMIDREAIIKVFHFLKPEHFYKEIHREIFHAITGLYRDHEPIDMRTVVNRLKKTGKLENVGGMYYIAELTGKVSSALNVESHARIIYEMWIKREMISMASRIHEQAYDDTTDAFDLLERNFNDWEFFKKHSTPENNEAKIKALWEERGITLEPKVIPPIIFIDQTPVAAPGDHTLVIGKKKARKTLFLTHLLDNYFKTRGKNPKKVAIFDTEQSKHHVWRMRQRIYNTTGVQVSCFSLRGMPPDERRDFIFNTVKFWEVPLECIVIDGVRDLMSNINDADESTQLIYWLENLTLTYNVAIIDVLHINKTDNNVRGHIGTELTNKTIATIQIDYDKKTGYSNCTCESSRDMPFNDFSFTHGPDGNILIIGGASGDGTTISPAERDSRMETCFEDDLMSYSDLKAQIRINFAVSQHKAETFIAEWLRTGLIVKNGKRGDPKTKYKLVGGRPQLSFTDIPEDHPETIRFKEGDDKQEDLPF